MIGPRISCLPIACLCFATASSRTQAGLPDYDFHWVSIGALSNPAYDGPDPFNYVTGRGNVGHSYRIAREEVSTAQWLEFVNTFSTQSDDLRLFGAPTHWGAVADPSYTGPGMRWRLRDAPDAARQPVYGITWRTAAMYCNWLGNGKPSEVAGLADGAYDTSTFTSNPDGTVNDQPHHSPEAQFWIPTLDEWLKAAHFDPNRYGPGAPGWWLYSHGSDAAPVPGLPGVGETSAGLRLPQFAELDIPLGAYPNTVSPWGLLDITGGASEWEEELLDRRERAVDGANAGTLFPELDQAAFFDTDFPFSQARYGLRIASIPSPPMVLVWLSCVAPSTLARRRRPCESPIHHSWQPFS